MADATRSTRTRRFGGLLLWFAVLGGAAAWAVHLFLAWGIEELTCAAGNREIWGIPLGLVLLIMTAVPGLVALAALAVAWHAWRRTARAEGDGRPIDRARLLAAVGLWADLLFVAIIAFDAAAFLVIPPCQS